MNPLNRLDETLKNRIERENISDYEFEMTLLRRKKLYIQLRRDGQIPYERFTMNTSKALGASERTIQRHMRVANAIKRGEFSHEILALYKAHQITYTQMIAILKDPSVEQEFQSAFPSKKKKRKGMLPQDRPQESCKHCSFGRSLVCPYCFNSVVVCTQRGYPILRKSTNGCREFQD